MRRRKNTRIKFTLHVAIICAAGLLPRPAWATDIRWTNGSGGSFNVASNWLGGPVPGTGDVAHFQVVTSGIGPSYTVNFGSDVTNEGSYIHHDNVTWNLGAHTYTLTGIPGFDSFVLGQVSNETGSVTISNGTLVTSDASSSYVTSIGQTSGGHGTVTLQSNAAWTDNAEERVGDAGMGTVNQVGGTAVVGQTSTNQNLEIAYAGSSTGTYNLGGGMLTVNGSTYVGGGSTSAGGAGILNLPTGGTMSVTGTLKIWNTPNSQINLQGGTVSVGSLDTSGNPSLFNWTAGTLNITGTDPVIIGNSASALNNIAVNLTIVDGQYLNTSGPQYVAFGPSQASTGSVRQTGGTNAVSQLLVLGTAPGDQGTYTLGGDGLLTVNGSEIVGAYGQGLFTQTGGSDLIDTDLIIGDSAPGYSATGEYDLGSGNLTVSGQEIVGNYGTGTFIQSGGTNTVGSFNSSNSELIIAAEPHSNGKYVLDGSLTVTVLSVGDEGTGVFNQSGGEDNITGEYNFAGELVLGAHGGSGTYNLQAGSLIAADAEIVGQNGTGVINQIGGSNTIGTANHSGYLSLGLVLAGVTPMGGIGTYNLAATGNLTVNGSAYIGGQPLESGGEGILNIQDGSATITDTLKIYDTPGTEVNLSGGTLTVGLLDTSGNPSRFNWIAGNLTITDSGLTIDSVGPLGSNLTISAAQGLSIADAEVVGYSGSATVTQTGGVNTALYLWLALLPGSTGTFTSSGGLASFSGGISVGGSSNFGAGGTGVLNVTGTSTLSTSGVLKVYDTPGTALNLNGGTINADSLDLSGNLSRFNWTAGTLNLTGTTNNIIIDNSPVANLATSLTITDGMNLSVATSEYIGFSSGAVGIVNQTGGSNVLNGGTLITQIDLGEYGASLGIYLLSGTGTVSSDFEVVGDGGTGSFVQSGGFNNVANFLNIGISSGSSGTYQLSGTGNLVANGGEAIGLLASSSGVFIQTGGTNDTGTLELGSYTGSNGSYLLRGGLLLADGICVGGDFVNSGGTGLLEIQGGTAHIGSSLIIFNTAGTSVDISSGVLTATTITSSGIINLSGGNLSTSSIQGGTLNISGGKARLTRSNLAQSAVPSLLQSLTITNGQLDLTSGQLILPYIGPSPLPRISSYIASGYDHGKWDGPGIISSTAASGITPQLVNVGDATTLGIAEASVILGISGSQTAVWQGQTVSATTLLIEYTWVGDANLDGMVTGTDLSMISLAGTSWTQGDFNYDSVVNDDDYSLFMLGAVYGGNTNISATLPEPCVVFGIGGLIFLNRRKKSARASA